MVSDEDLARARREPTFRRQLVAGNLEHLLTALARLRASPDPDHALSSRQMHEGAELAVKLAEILQRAGGRPRPL
jgi:hypothetical protein